MATGNYLENLLDEEIIRNLIVRIGEVSDITGIPTRKIRYWEEKGIIHSVDDSNSARRYDYINIKRIFLIKELIEEGYTLEAASNKVDDRISRLVKAFDQLSKKVNQPDEII